MPNVVYLKYLHFNHAGPSPQGRIYHAVYQEDREQICCPHCKSNECYRHGFYKRRVTFANKEETVRRVCLKIERYRCRCCGRTFAVGCEMIGTGKYQRRNKPIVHASQAGETNKSIAARKGAKE